MNNWMNEWMNDSYDKILGTAGLSNMFLLGKIIIHIW